MKTWMSLVVLCGVANTAACCSTSGSSQGDAALDQAVTADAADSGSTDNGSTDNGSTDNGSTDNGPDVTPDAVSDAGDASDAGDGAIAPPMRCPACTGTGCAIVEVTTGSRFSCARRASGAVLCWGDNTLGELGDGTRIASSRPVEVLGVCDAVDLEAGSGTACARRRSGQVSCWGSNASGTLGAGIPFATLASSNAPRDAMGLGDATALAGGAGFFCAVRVGGAVVCWGANGAGQLGGAAAGTESPTPVALPGVVDATAVATSQFGCALRAGGGVVCWGRNLSGRLGSGALTDNPMPTPVSGLAGATGIAIGVWHACALRSDDTLACWGDNALGTLAAPPTATPTASAAPVAGVTNVQQVVVGYRHTCALLRDRTVVCWGKNSLGELGRGAASPCEAAPAPVMGLSDVAQITAHSPNDGAVEGGHTCALRRDGAVLCWGKNDLGQLGDGTTMTRAAPVTVTF